MADESIIADDSEPGGDGWTLGRLARDLGRRIPLYCFEKLLVLGREKIPTMSIPNGIDQRAFPVYKRYTRMGSLNMADTIVKAVTDRQQPNGFRIKGERIRLDTEADDLADSLDLWNTVDRVCDDVAKYGSGYVLVSKSKKKDNTTSILYVSPWSCNMSDAEDAGCMYSHDPVENKERLMLFRLTESETGQRSVYYRIAEREHVRSLVAPTDEDEVQRIGDTYDTDNPEYWEPGNDWEWAGEPITQGMEYALANNHIPLYRGGPEGYVSQVSPHIPTILRIDQGIFDRMCIVTMQAFRQRAIKGLKRMTYRKTDPQVQAGMATEGQPIQYDSLFAMSPAALWLLPDDCEVWESQITDFRPFLEAESNDIKHLATASRTPVDVLSPDVAGSAAGANLKHEQLVAKVNKLNQRIGKMFSQALRMALTLNGDKQAAERTYEMTWLPPEPRDWMSLGEAYSKIKGGLPTKTIWRLVFGLNDQEMADAEQDLQDAAFQQALANETVALNAKTAEQTAGTLPDELASMPDGDMFDDGFEDSDG